MPALMRTTGQNTWQHCTLPLPAQMGASLSLVTEVCFYWCKVFFNILLLYREISLHFGFKSFGMYLFILCAEKII